MKWRRTKNQATPDRDGLLSKATDGLRKDLKARGPWVTRDRIGTRVFLGVLCLGVLGGPVACVGTALQSRPRTQPAPVTTPSSRLEQEAARGAALRFTRDWLTAVTGQEALLLSQMTDKQAGATNLELPERRPDQPRSIDAWTVESAGSKTWRVRVVVDGERAFDVFVQVPPDRPREAAITMLPSQVPLEAARQSTGSDLAELTDLPTTHPAGVAATGFTKALLTGTDADVARWTAPSAGLSAVQPRACREATPLRAQTDRDELPAAPATGTTTVVVVTIRCQEQRPGATPSNTPATATTPDRATAQMLAYALTLTGRDGRWEVSAITNRPTATSTSTDPSSPTYPTPTPTPQ